MALGLGAEFFEVVADALGQRSDAACSGTVVKFAIDPQGAQHLHQVRFTRAIEATDPHGRLLGLFDVLQVGIENVLQALFVLPIADERCPARSAGLIAPGWFFRH
jgi:hypothetical protein